ncbi:glycosyltransferase family 25 protein [Ruegeria marina]|uniref:Glycosyltransferase involved in LPS biosynthesis, GR25 family n=1 Tax=Ruegeria marina TaxID=639004 RepID=A0A1G6NH32_9RHOB|nr:glycosyltransferase family 25 protein [Ruegeria marina]SDC67118.1 Glycosyltransferase involved in LPS biosynthesis, GR25 family [Ruegeria marina]
MDLIGLVIHLERATDRRARAEALVAELPDANLLPAVDGAALSPDARGRAFRPGLLKPAYPFDLRPGEIGCFLSHRTAWAMLVESRANAALIVEDDMALDDNFSDALELAKRHVDRIGYVQFQTRSVAAPEIDRHGNCILTRPVVTPLRTSGQLVSRRAAERLLDLTEPFDRPVDTFLQMHWYTGIQLGAISPSGLVDQTQAIGGSTISGRKSLGNRLIREWKRARYRAAVRRLSRDNTA